MFFEERLELLKGLFPEGVFKVPFVDGTEILKTIERHFVIYRDVTSDLTNLGQYHGDWAKNLKSKTHILTAPIVEMDAILQKLDVRTNYWVVLSMGKSTGSKHLVFDCKLEAIHGLVSISKCDFFIGDKKYAWLASFQLDPSNGTIVVYKSGSAVLPFE